MKPQLLPLPLPASFQDQNAQMPTGIDFLAHKQLHEVLFDFLPEEEVLNYRRVHSACDTVVECWAQARIQDTLGQELPSTEWQEPQTAPRTVDVCFLNLMKIRGRDLKDVIASLPGGVRSLSPKLLRGESKSVSKSFKSICAAMTAESVLNLQHVDVSNTADDAIAALLRSVAASAKELQYLSASGTPFTTDEIVKLVATNCTKLESLDVSWIDGRIEEDSVMLLATNCAQLKSLNIGATGSEFTDNSIEHVATNCPQLESLDVSFTGGFITDASMKLLVAKCRQLRSLNINSTGTNVTDDTIKVLATSCPEL